MRYILRSDSLCCNTRGQLFLYWDRDCGNSIHITMKSFFLYDQLCYLLILCAKFKIQNEACKFMANFSKSFLGMHFFPVKIFLFKISNYWGIWSNFHFFCLRAPLCSARYTLEHGNCCESKCTWSLWQTYLERDCHSILFT